MNPSGALLIRIVAVAGRRVAEARRAPRALTIDELSLIGTSEAKLARGRVLELELSRSAGTSFLAKAPTGSYRALELSLRGGFAEKRLAASFPLDLAVDEGEPAELTITVDIEALDKGADLETAIRLAVAPRDISAKATMPKRGATSLSLAHGMAPGSFLVRSRPATARMPAMPASPEEVRIEIPEGALAPGTEIQARLPRPIAPPKVGEVPGLPALFRGQHVLGPVVEVTASAPLNAAISLTLPYDPMAAAVAGIDPEDIVVLELDDRQTLYREIRPSAVDRARNLLTVRAGSLSSFFPCSPGIEISAPRLGRDAAGGVSAWSSARETTIAGRIVDPGATASLHDAPSGAPLAARGGWQAQGWFDFEGVALAPRLTHVAVRGEVEGLLAHECAFAIRADPPPKRVTDPSRHYGPRLAVSESDLPIVTAVVGYSSFNSDDLVGPFAEWQQKYSRYGPFIYRPTEDGRHWEWRALLPELHFEEAAATVALGQLRALLPVPVPPGAPADRAALSALAALIAGLEPDAPLRRSVEAFLDSAGRKFGLATLSISATVPVIARRGSGFAAAFVAATPAGVAAAEASLLRKTFRLLHNSLRAGEENRIEVNAGRLFFVSGSFDRFEREVVAELAWCATVQLKADPATGAPLIAAIEPQPDEGEAARSLLVLYRRRAVNNWTREVVIAGAPVVDFDFDFTAASGTGDTPVWFVAAIAGSEIDIKTHMRVAFRAAAGWLNSPYEYQWVSDPSRVFDLGLWPRIVTDAAGQSAIAFVTHALGLVVWRLAAADGEVVRASVIAQSSHMALTGSNLPPSKAIVQLDTPVTTSGLSLAHWAATVAPAEPGAIWCAFGDGALKLAHIDLKTREVAIQVLDVDRITGFYPALARRRTGAAAIAYKDPWGPGGFGNADARDDLFFFSYEQGNLVPPAEVPLAPAHAKRIFQLTELPYVPLDCGQFVDAATDFMPLLASVILHRPMQVVLVPQEGDDPLSMTQIAYSHRGTAQQYGRLHKKPGVLALTIDNSAATNEDIESIEIAQFIDPIGTAPRSEIAKLNNNILTADVLAALMATGVRLSQTPPHVGVRNPGHSWDIIDPDAYTGGGANPLREAQVYNLRDNGKEIEIFLGPAVAIIDRARRMSDQGLPEPCGQPVPFWDAQMRPFIDQLDIISLDVPDVPGRMRFAQLSNIHFLRLEPRDPANLQQGGLRFVFEIPSFYARIDDPDADVFSTEPSYIYQTVAPFVQGDWVGWWPREGEARIGHVEVDVAYGIVDWLGVVISFIPGLRETFFLVDHIADSVATSAANDELKPPGTGNLSNLLLQIMRHQFDRSAEKLPRPIEAIWLRGRSFTAYSRRPIVPQRPAEPDLNLTPGQVILFGSALPGAAPVRRNLLLTSDGEVASFLEEVRLQAGAGFRIVSPPRWPGIVIPGASEIVTIEFTPAAPAGLRGGQVVVRSNGGQQASVALSAEVLAPPEPSLRVRPPQIQFGTAIAGSVERREVELLNDGAGVLQIVSLQLVAGALPAGMLQLETPAPFSVPAGGSAVVTLRLAPPVGGPASVQAALVIVSNDPARPRLDMAVTATIAMGMLLANPGALEFPQSPIAVNQPQLPPGLPPTVHRGPTRVTTIYNQGAVNLTLQGASLRARDQNGAVSPHFVLWQADGAPLAAADRQLPSGASLPIIVEFAATVPGDHTARLEVRATDATQAPAIASMHGVAI